MANPRVTDSAPIDPSRVAVVIPALNEALRIRDVVSGALAHCPNVIVVDDGSDDATVERIADLPVIVLRHVRRMGKGASLPAASCASASSRACANVAPCALSAVAGCRQPVPIVQ